MLVALYNNVNVNELLYGNGGYAPRGYGKMETLPMLGRESRPYLYGVGLYDTGFHGFLSRSMSVNAYSHHVKCALWFLERFYQLCVVVWDAIHAMHE
ncbi:hypothetical protein MTR67_034770 [Solanum verrucosum]|uniref:Uncharacterized protein n=1 Tax=Solanum verrucosum TaxID=315347 RepID=A0AAF0U8Z5_SOLVR|nr:hypothetical protein MTR67_034770 [Solanum verrucosum]